MSIQSYHGKKILGCYDNNYLKADVLLLADVFKTLEVRPQGTKSLI